MLVLYMESWIVSCRKFLCSHLAQMIYIFPEAIQLEKILVQDKESLLVVPDMKIMLLKDAVKHNSHPDQSVSISLCKAFRERLLNFFSTHPEVSFQVYSFCSKTFSQP